ncbi:sigma-54-dependent Fis family transcriptional regulator [candidate division KSB1 bacterium]|nr:sigma-54-dependent Fis family transcriptional regulator [candidate division KSB1 bacterium]
MARILIVEDDRNTLSGLVQILQDEGYEVTGIDTGTDALRLLSRETFDVMLTDFRMPDLNGLELYEKIAPYHPGMKTIILTAFSTVKDAVEAMKKGIYHYLTKPINLDELFILIKKAIREQEILLENKELKDRIRSTYRFENMIGNSEPILEVFRKISKVARSQATVLIRGESGVGKELVARAIHYNSPRAEKPLVEISCASLPETLLESELFGYEKGAFTGAHAQKKGRFEVADGGTIFLDEIADVSESVQVKLLRALQEKVISRLGSTESIKIDVRVITATNRDLEKAVADGSFREDLYYRLNVIPIYVPPLRERKADIPLLIEHFLKKYALENDKHDMRFSNEALEYCMSYHWPGNIRELENAVENAVVLADENTIYPSDMPFSIYTDRPNDEYEFLGDDANYREKLDQAERVIIKRTIDRAGGNKSRAAKLLGMSLRTMRYKIKKYKL